MKKNGLFVILLLTVALLFSACSKKAADKLVGKWQDTKTAEMEKMNPKVNFVYEFTKENKMLVDIKVTHNINGKDTVIHQPPITASFVIKKDDGTIVEFEASSPEMSDKKLTFIVVFYNDKEFIIIDPNMQASKFTKI